MKQIKITKEQLNKLLSMNNPLIVYEKYIDEGDKIVCDETNETYLVTETKYPGTSGIDFEKFDYIEIKVDYINLYDWEKNKNSSWTDKINFSILLKLEKIIQSKDIVLNLLEHK